MKNAAIHEQELPPPSAPYGVPQTFPDNHIFLRIVRASDVAGITEWKTKTDQGPYRVQPGYRIISVDRSEWENSHLHTDPRQDSESVQDFEAAFDPLEGVRRASGRTPRRKPRAQGEVNIPPEILAQAGPNRTVGLFSRNVFETISWASKRIEGEHPTRKGSVFVSILNSELSAARGM